MIRIDADLLIPGRGDPIRNGTVVMEGPTIAYAGPASTAPTVDDETSNVSVVMPGMWDCHGHFFGFQSPDVATMPQISESLATSRSLRDARLALESGFTSIREVGGIGTQLAAAIAEGSAVGPNIYGAGNVLSQTGGHFDLHSLPLDWVASHPMTALCDGVPEVLKAVRSQLRRNARVIKLCASGGVATELDHPIHQQFSDEELRAAVEEAGRAERAVAAHCHGKPGIMAALRAGVKTIEHGTWLDEEAADLMLENDAILVPTRLVVEMLLDMLEAIPAHVRDKILMVADVHAQALHLAVDRGVKIAVGCDLFVTGGLWGQNGRELGLLVDHGMTPLQAIQAATANAPETLGPQAPKSGLLEEGYDADIITLDSDPLSDVSTLADGSHVTGVWKAGAQVA